MQFNRPLLIFLLTSGLSQREFKNRVNGVSIKTAPTIDVHL